MVTQLSVFIQLKMRYEKEGLSELCIRLLECWEEKEVNKATRKRLANALWMAGEGDLAKKYSNNFK